MIKQLKSRIDSDIHLLELVKGSSVALLLRSIGMLLGYVVSLIVARKYGTQGMGIWALTLSYVSIALIFSKAGLDISTMKFIARFKAENDTASIKGVYWKSLKIVLFFSLLISVVFLYLSEISAIYIFNNARLSNAFAFAVPMIILLSLIQFHAEAIRGYKKIAHYFIINGISTSFVTALLLSLNIDHIWSNYVYIDIYVIAQCATVVLAIIIWLKDSKILNHTLKNTISTKKLFESSFPIMIAGSMTLIMGSMDAIMLGIFKSETDVGIYAIALKLSMLTSIVLIAVNSILAPKISQMFGSNDLDNLQNIIRKSTKMIFIISMPVLVVYFLYPEYVMSFFGEGFKIGASALVILAAGQFFNAISGPAGQVLNMTDKEYILRDTAIIATLANLILNYVLIPQYGINGAAIATAISGILWNLLCVVYIYRKLGILVMYFPFLRV